MTRARLTAGPQLARDPGDVPTPLAIAVATFCRLSGRPADGEAVRAALALLRPDEDGRVEAFLAAADTSLPLGPRGVVEVVRGRSVREASAIELEPSAPSAPEPEAAPPEKRSRSPRTRAKAKADSKHEPAGASAEPEAARVVPRIRKAGDKPVRIRPSAPVPPSLPKRGSRRPPRGRLSAGTPAHRDRSELHTEKGRLLLEELITAHRGHHPTLLRRLNDLFGSPKQKPLVAVDLEALLAKHHLGAQAEARSLERLRMLLQQHRGDLGRVAGALKVSREELRKDLERRGQWDSFERARDRFRREVFAQPMAEQAFLLLHRRGQLSDLGALAPLEKSLGEVTRAAWERCKGEVASAQVSRFARVLAVSEERAAELKAHFGLTGG